VTAVRLALLAAALLLASCGPRDEAAQPDADAPDGAGTEVLNAIPARFHGVWDVADGTCMAASDLRLEIAGGNIGFYESRGTVTAVTEDADGAAIIALAMEGEGEQWDMDLTLARTETGSGERLAVTWPAQEGRPAPRPILLRRCPA
jgi:hypothetical protein